MIYHWHPLLSVSIFIKKEKKEKEERLVGVDWQVCENRAKSTWALEGAGGCWRVLEGAGVDRNHIKPQAPIWRNDVVDGMKLWTLDAGNGAILWSRRFFCRGNAIRNAAVGIKVLEWVEGEFVDFRWRWIRLPMELLGRRSAANGKSIDCM